MENLMENQDDAEPIDSEAYNIEENSYEPFITKRIMPSGSTNVRHSVFSTRNNLSLHLLVLELGQLANQKHSLLPQRKALPPPQIRT